MLGKLKIDAKTVGLTFKTKNTPRAPILSATKESQELDE